MLRYKRQIQLALIPPILCVSYYLRNKFKHQAQLNQQQTTLLEKYKFLSAQIPFDSKSLNTKQNFIPQTLLNTIYPKLKTRNQMMQNIKQRKYDLLIVGSSPLAALTLLQATNRGLEAALISQSDFGSYSQLGQQNEYHHNNIETLDSGKQIFFKAICFKYGALSFNMMRHAFHLSKSQYELKDLAPRSVKEVNYNHYYSAEIGVFSRMKQNTKGLFWNFFNILYSLSWITDAGVSYAQKCDQKKKQSSEQKSLFNELDSTYGLRKAKFKSKQMEVNWNRFVRDTLITASIKDFFFTNKKEADYLNNISFKEMVLDDRSGNIQNVIVCDVQNQQTFEIKTRAVIDFRNINHQGNQLHQDGEINSIGVYQDQQNKQIIKNQNSENYYFCVQTPQSQAFFKNPMFFKGYSFSKYQKNRQSQLQEKQIEPTLKINNAKLEDRKIKKLISNQDLTHDKILSEERYPSSALVQYRYNKQQGEINSSLLKFRKSKYMITLKISQKLNLLLKYFSSKIFRSSSSYTAIEKPYKFMYQYKSDQKGNYISISGGNPNFVINDSKQIIEQILNEQNFRGTAYSINQSYHSVGQYILSGSYSAPSVAAFDTSPGNSMLQIQKFKEELQSKYSINDQMFYHLFYSYGYIGTLRIIDIGAQFKMFNKETNQQNQTHPFTAAQIVYLIRYQQLRNLKDLIFKRWGLFFEPVEEVDQILASLDKSKKQFKQLKKVFRQDQIQEVKMCMLQRERLSKLEESQIKQ